MNIHTDRKGEGERLIKEKRYRQRQAARQAKQRKRQTETQRYGGTKGDRE